MFFGLAASDCRRLQGTDGSYIVKLQTRILVLLCQRRDRQIQPNLVLSNTQNCLSRPANIANMHKGYIIKLIHLITKFNYIPLDMHAIRNLEGVDI